VSVLRREGGDSGATGLKRELIVPATTGRARVARGNVGVFSPAVLDTSGFLLTVAVAGAGAPCWTGSTLTSSSATSSPFVNGTAGSP